MKTKTEIYHLLPIIYHLFRNCDVPILKRERNRQKKERNIQKPDIRFSKREDNIPNREQIFKNCCRLISRQAYFRDIFYSITCNIFLQNGRNTN